MPSVAVDYSPMVANSFLDWWGLSIPQTLLLVAVILMLVDFFIQSDILTHVAYVVFALTLAFVLPVHIMFRLLAGFLAWVGMIYIHYTLWRDFVTQFANRIVAPTKYQTGPRGLIGQQGCVKSIDDRSMVSIEGDLWTYEASETLPAGTRVVVIGERAGSLRVEALMEVE